MNFYSNLKIRNKLILGFATVVLMAVALGGFGYLQIHKLNNAANFLFERGVKPEEYIGDIAVNFERMRISLRDFAQAKDQVQRDYYEERVEKFHSRIEAAEKKLEAVLPDDESKRLFSLMNNAHLEYHPFFNQVVKLSQLKKSEEAIAYLKSEDVEATEGFQIDTIENLQTYLVENAEKMSNLNTATAMITGRVMLTFVFAAFILGIIMTILITRSIGNPLHKVLEAVLSQQRVALEKSRLVEAIANGDLDQEVIITTPLEIPEAKVGKDETGMLLKAIIGMSQIQFSQDKAFARMTDSLRQNHEQELEYRKQQEIYRKEETIRDWFKSGQNELGTILRGDKTGEQLSQQSLSFLTEYIGARVGVFYLFDSTDVTLKIAAGYALPKGKLQLDRIELGEGLAGQAAQERKMLCLKDAPAGYLPISSTTGESESANIVALPLLYNDALFGIIEIGSFKSFTDSELDFLQQSAEGIAITLSVNRLRG
ncbi:MAG: MCP four helix bundle domain-containing protein [Desulfuromonadaceae bacterium]|nr:MCP four helix bundle domain-containing protein [Desulfuromonadaceae bacterium]MDD2855945.1 MCP four helix bundle domain-containing protein [Desulfuromonadaceae bacterium]